MGELRVRSALVTGANRGIGLGFVQHLLALPNPPEWVFATCRDPKGQRAQVRLGWTELRWGTAGLLRGTGCVKVSSRELQPRTSGTGQARWDGHGTGFAWGARGSLGSGWELLLLPGTGCPRAAGKGPASAVQTRV